eukprot:3924377-Amphidinium_carterae.1
MPEHVQEVLKDNQLLLMKALLEETGYQDQGIVDEMAHGIKLIHKGSTSAAFPKEVRLATFSEY